MMELVDNKRNQVKLSSVTPVMDAEMRTTSWKLLLYTLNGDLKHTIFFQPQTSGVR